MLTVLEVIARSTAFLSGRGVEPARLNAESLVGHALGLKRMQLYLQFERALTEPELETIRGLVRRRGLREPLQYIVGEVEFHGLRLKADRRALIPRPETEQLVDLLVRRLGERPPGRILDLGTGSGAIALALAKAWPGALVLALDASPDALTLALENAEGAGLAGRVTFLQSDWYRVVPEGEPFDLVVANPPYLSAAETASAEPEVREHEPAPALTAGEDGLAALRTILRDAPRFLAPSGWLALETGPDQHAELTGLAAESGLVGVESLKDLAGRDRVITARMPGPGR
jgi:release factor glutamine methyltransferase